MMTIRIIPFRLVPDHNEGGDASTKTTYAIPVDTFDTNRHTGDTEFALNVPFAALPQSDNDFSKLFVRPINFKHALDWVSNSTSVNHTDKDRLVNLLHQLELDNQLYLYFSWS